MKIEVTDKYLKEILDLLTTLKNNAGTTYKELDMINKSIKNTKYYVNKSS